MRSLSCLLCLAFIAGCSRDPVKTSRQYIASGDRYASQQKYKEAAIEYRNAIKLVPNAPEAHEKLAGVSGEMQDTPTALAEVLRVADLRPDDPKAQLRAAAVFVLAGRFADARSRAESALKLGIDPGKTSDAHVVLGEALAGLHDPEESEAHLREAVRLSPESAPAHIALGSLLASTGRAHDAAPEFTRAVQIAPRDFAANRAMALFLMATGRGDDAEPFWSTIAAITKTPLTMADYYAAQGRVADATREVDAVLAHDSRNVPALMLRSRLLYAGRKLDAAIAAAQSAEAADPTSADAAFLEGQLQTAKGSADLALHAFQRTTKLNPRASSAHLLEAILLDISGRRPEARRIYEEILAENPRAGIAANNLACINLDEGRLEDALRQALVAKREMDRSPEVNDTLGWVYVKRHQPDLAVPLLEQSVAARPDHDLYRMHLDAARADMTNHTTPTKEER